MRFALLICVDGARQRDLKTKGRIAFNADNNDSDRIHFTSLTMHSHEYPCPIDCTFRQGPRVSLVEFRLQFPRLAVATTCALLSAPDKSGRERNGCEEEIRQTQVRQGCGQDRGKRDAAQEKPYASLR